LRLGAGVLVNPRYFRNGGEKSFKLSRVNPKNLSMGRNGDYWAIPTGQNLHWGNFKAFGREPYGS